MPYTDANDKKLPDYIKKRTLSNRKGWVSVFNAAYKKYGESKAFQIANAWLKKQVKKKGFIKRSTLTFDVCSNGFISRDKNGEEYVTLVLNTTKAHRDGITFTEDMLKDMAKQINKNPIVGDIDHILYNKILKSDMSDEMVKTVLRNKPGIAKTLKAIYNKGKLWVRAIIDKRYKKLIQKAKGVSSEIFFTERDGKKFSAGEILGFTFNIKSTPAEYQAGVVA